MEPTIFMDFKSIVRFLILNQAMVVHLPENVFSLILKNTFGFDNDWLRDSILVLDFPNQFFEVLFDQFVRSNSMENVLNYNSF